MNTVRAMVAVVAAVAVAAAAGVAVAGAAGSAKAAPAAGIAPSPAAASEMVPFVIPATPNPKSLIAFPWTPIAADGPRVTVEDGHFMVGKSRVKIWGVNNTFGANVPSHAEAERMAARLAAAGVNSVRFHHMDTSTYPNGIVDPRSPLKIAPEALERMDYLIDQFARHGIYANLNLHVGRTASRALGLPASGTDYDKMVGIFTPALIDAQKEYARDLLGRVNPYRKVRYADDPAVAFVEITNEDSLFMWGSRRSLEALPDFYAKILRGKYAAWLKARYGTTDALRQAWAKGSEPLGRSLLAPDRFPAASDAAATGWRLELHDPCIANLAPQAGAVRVEITRADETTWHIQLKQAPLALKGGQYYTVSFRARADGPRRIQYAVGQEHDPWANLGLSGEAALDKNWKTVRAGFVASSSDTAARLSFSVGGSAVAVELADVVLAPGGQTGLGPGESIEASSVALFAPSEVAARAADRGRFLAETEKTYFDGMRTFLRKDLGVKGLVTGTIVFGPSGLYGQSGMDFVDGHAYWRHPNFPGRPWDMANWTVEQDAMVDRPQGSTFLDLSAQRFEGKPYTVSEYNHPAPNDHQAECVPMLAAWAAAQDWDGVWLFDYWESQRDMDPDRIGGFFDMAANPAKWGFMRAGAAIFRQGAIPPHARTTTLNLTTTDDCVGDLAALQARYDLGMFSAVRSRMPMTWETLLGTGLEVSFAGHSGATDRGGGASPKMLWKMDSRGRGVFSASGPGGQVAVVHGQGAYGVISVPGVKSETGGKGPSNSDGPLIVDLLSPDFAAVTVTALDGRPLEKSEAILVAACGRAENTDMKFSTDRRTVGRNWGRGPVLIEAVEGTLRLPRGAWKCAALAPDGTPQGDVLVKVEGTGDAILALSPRHKTMWYLVTPAEKP